MIIRHADQIEDLRKSLKKDPKNSAVLRAIGRVYLNLQNFKDAENYFNLAAAFNPRIIPDIEIDYETLLEQDPENIRGRNSFVSFYLSQGETENAIFELEEFLDVAPWAADAYNILGQVYLKIDKIDESIALLEKSIKYGINNLALSEMLAGAYLEKGKDSEAINMYEDMVKKEPTNKLRLRILGDLYKRNKNYESAAVCYYKMIEDDPEVSAEICDKLKLLDDDAKNNFNVKKFLAEVYTKCLKPDQAIDKYEEMLKISPKRLDEIAVAGKKILQYYPDHIRAMEFLANILMRKGDYSEATQYLNRILEIDFKRAAEIIESYKKILELYPNQVLTRSSLAHAYIETGNIEGGLLEMRAVACLNPGDCDNIGRQCREIIKEHPKMLLAHQVLAEILLAKGDYKKSIDTAEEIIKVDKNYLPAYLIIGEGYKSIGIYSKSIEAFKNALRFEPYSISIQEKLKIVAEKDLDKEIEHLRGKIGQDPWRISLHLDLGKLYLKRGVLNHAIKELQIALKDQQKLAGTYCMIGTAFKELGKYDMAEVQFQKSVENSPKDDPNLSKTARLHLACCLEAQGKIDNSLVIYENILQEDIEFGDIKKKIKYLSAINPVSVRNKTLACLCSRLGEKDIIGIWARDKRKIRSAKRQNALLMSFGQNNNNNAFDNFIKEKFKAAEEELQLGIGLDPKLVASLNNLAMVYLKDARFEMAQAKLNEAIEEDPTYPVSHNNLGLVYFVKGQFELAEKEFLLSIKADKDFAIPYINLADLQYLSGNSKDAISNWKKAGGCFALDEIILRRLKYKIL